jgi:hydrogenase nickel incorporation protein HypA/HybF
MHEFSIVEGLMGIITETAKSHGLTRVDAVKLRIGKLRQADPQALDFAFEALAEGTVAQGAKISIEEIPVRIKCNDCSAELTADDYIFFCTACESRRVTVITGKELYIDSLEGD